MSDSSEKSFHQDVPHFVVARYERKPLTLNSLLVLAQPFGIVCEHIVLNNKAFLEMQTHEEAVAMVTFYQRKPAVLHGKKITFYLSQELFVIEVTVKDTGEGRDSQTSRVVCFCRLPPGKEKNTELIAIAKRFGQVKRSLFLPNRVFVEMAELEHAQKLVDYYTSHPLKMKGKNVLVSYSTEYTTLNPRRSSSNSKSESREMESTTTQTKEAGSVGELPQAGGNTQPEPKEESAGDSSKETTAELEGGNKEDSKVPAKEHDPSPMGTSKETAIVGQDVTDQAGHEDGKQEGNLKPLDSDSDIEGMEVIGEDEEDRVPDEDLAKQDVCDRPEKLGPKQEPAEVSEAGLPDVSAGRSSSENDGMAEQVTPEDLGQAEPRGVHSEELKEAPASEEV
uniref:RRM domain-containing protein n=1 Tax=Scleropages formosus TaxID=113540 RepID=A0A8C9T6G2_SCLFO